MSSSLHSETGSTMGEQNTLNLKVLTYRNLSADKLMIQYPPRPVPEAITQTVSPRQTRQSRASSMGRFNTLPAEITDIILDYLDIQSLKNVMLINNRCKAIVESLPAYRDIFIHASETVKALMSTSLVSHFTVGQLNATLRNDRCERCKKFGPFLFLPTCTRCCFFCICHDLQLRVMTVSAAEACFGITRKDLQQLPILESSPQFYDQKALRRKQQLSLVSHPDARALGVATFGSEENMMNFVQKSYNAKCLNYDQRMAAWRQSRDHKNKRPCRPQSLTESTICDWGIASILFPFLNFRDRSVQWGVSCKGCADDYRYIHHDKLNDLSLDEDFRMGLIERGHRYYSEEEFLEHFQECDAAKGLWVWRSLPTVEAETQ